MPNTWRARRLSTVTLTGVAVVLAACNQGPAKAPAKAPAAPAEKTPPAAAQATPAEGGAQPSDEFQAAIFKPFTGDLDQMVKRRMIRVGAPYNRTFYFVDAGVQRGVTYEFGKAFEDAFNKKLKTNSQSKVHVVFVPLSRDALASALLKGRVDLVAAQVTVSPRFQALADFTRPTRTNVSEVVVTGPGGPAITSVDDLSGKEVWVRSDSKYHDNLVALNRALKAKGKPPVIIGTVPGSLEDDDLLEMTNAGLIPITVVDNYLADFWSKIFTKLTVHENVTVASGGSLAVAVRKTSPQLKEALNQFIGEYGIGTSFGNTVMRRYLSDTKFAKNATSQAEQQKFLDLVGMFRKYGDQYNMDYLLMAAQGYQESQLNQNAKSAVGSVGVMQVQPATGKQQGVGDITQIDPNIHAGVKYMRYMRDRYFEGQPMNALNKGLFTFAAYNAGPAKINKLRQMAAQRGLNPNIWFGNVEAVASDQGYGETVTYVSNIFKYYVAYKLVLEQNNRRRAAEASLRGGAKP
jgi:membrane-bound lytic murein transglycosylase MltF